MMVFIVFVLKQVCIYFEIVFVFSMTQYAAAAATVRSGKNIDVNIAMRVKGYAVIFFA
jgi:hypothetical protein